MLRVMPGICHHDQLTCSVECSGGEGIVRIPLDYYRILGLPIQATAEQLQQAHRDRTLQLPRREFSEAAIEARKELIDEAHAVLSDLARRQAYDASFLAKSYDLIDLGRDAEDAENENGAAAHRLDDSDLGVDLYTPSIDIQEPQFVGVLLILLELGEYELVLKLGRPYVTGGSRNLSQGQFGEPGIVSADIVLTVALACLELGREQWQQGQYENAAESLETGRELLLREGVFAHIRGEMQSDLYKLRPYRVLELLALPESHLSERRHGMTLLEDMLQDRGGIDGTGNDQSGLSVDDFLRFIQQLRSYLTAAEQQVLFEVEARRPSAVATYLAVYSLVAKGFADRQPALVRRAKAMLLRLGIRQDVHLEQAVCALLLGQTEEASRALELSQEFESLGFIRDHSQGSPDLLPGLCLYSERWLQNEVFPHFRDLIRRSASLKEYFADEEVQAYLEELPNDPEAAQPWAGNQPAPGYTMPPQEFGTIAETRPLPLDRLYTSRSGTATIEPDAAESNGNPSIPAAERITQPVTEGRNGMRSTTDRTGQSSNRTPDRTRNSAATSPATQGTQSQQTPARRRSNGRKGLRLDRLVFLAAIGLLGLAALAFIASRLFGSPEPAGAPTSEASPATAPTGNAQSGFSEITKQQQAVGIGETLTKDNAIDVVKSWLTAKTEAMGNQHQTTPLAQILAEPALSDWQTRAEKAKSENWYWSFEHPKVEIVSVETAADSTSSTTTEPTDPTDPAGTDSSPSAASATASPDASSSTTPPDTASPSSSSSNDSSPDASGSDTADKANQAQIEAIVTERGDLYTNGQVDKGSSYESTLRVRYDMVRSQGQWRISSMEVLQ